MYCIRCGKKEPHFLCDVCLEAKQAYVDAYDEASAGGVFMGVGDLGNRNRDAADIREALKGRVA